MKRPKLTAIGGKDVAPRADAEEFYKELAVDVLARTIWGEARAEGHIGMEAVAAVVLNRVKVAEAHGGKYWWGSDVISVCQSPYQFSCWNRSDPNFQKLQAVDESNLYFVSARRVAARAVYSKIEDPTGGATHYHADYVSPYWAKNQVPTATIGRHIFYKLVEI